MKFCGYLYFIMFVYYLLQKRFLLPLKSYTDQNLRFLDICLLSYDNGYIFYLFIFT